MDLTEALALEPHSDGSWRVLADPRYESISGMFGGWTAAVALASVVDAATPRDGPTTPSALTVNYIGRVDPGTEVVLRPRPLGGGRSIGHWSVEVMTSAGVLLAVGLVVLGNRRETDGHTQPVMPDVPGPEELETFHPPGSQGERMVHRPVVGHPPFGRFDSRSIAWVRDATGRAVDHVQLAFLADSYAPRSFFWSDGPGPSATLTISVQFHGTDEEIAAVGDDYVLTEAVGTRGVMSTSGQRACIWSRPGALLVTTDQLCWYR